ncbi:hypothetical protein F4821DRAFT_275589 [Hypoxylon rubiginosum]|uniref:Uncharacterized protein n=1 Tax=Hypoxylon rubiginosum TaxID=110542 RepID=A0ACC0DB65_9PEZI|nr:hypothetical protein F4821DRAFT_275589 [Hypoxylon rubiginosum]
MAARFELFNQFPYELRRAVWDHALDDIPPRTFAFSFYDTSHPYKKLIVPPIVHACHESRDAAASYYGRRLYQDRRDVEVISATGWFNPEKDILYFKSLVLDSDVEDMLERLKDQYPNFGLDRVRNIAFDKLFGEGLTLEKPLIKQCYRVLPSMQTFYWMIPDKDIPSSHWPLGQTIKQLTMIPSPYLRPGETYPPTKMFRLVNGGRWTPRERLRDYIESLVIEEEIPREPKVIEARFAMPRESFHDVYMRWFSDARSRQHDIARRPFDSRSYPRFLPPRQHLNMDEIEQRFPDFFAIDEDS